MTILIKGGHVINPATQMDEVADVLIEDQKIKKIGKELPEKEAERVINADGCYVMPGFIDMHVHFRDPGFEQKEDIYTGMQAAAHGGYTTVLTMPNTKPVADNPDIVNYVHNKARGGEQAQHLHLRCVISVILPFFHCRCKRWRAFCTDFYVPTLYNLPMVILFDLW